jgi:hypothetical protein
VQLAIFLGIDDSVRTAVASASQTGRLVAEMMQILVRKEGIDDLIECYRHIVVDNASTCPHCPFERFAERVLSQGERVMRNRANSYHARYFEIFKLIQRGDRGCAHPRIPGAPEH